MFFYGSAFKGQKHVSLTMKNTIKHTLALDSNKWIKLIEEIESRQNAEKWQKYIEENNFEVIVPDIVVKELLWVISIKNKAELCQENKTSLIRLMKAGQEFAFRHIKSKHEDEYYYRAAAMLIKKHNINAILKAHGLYHIIDGREMYALHKDDVAIFISLKELGKIYYFVTHDNGIKNALNLPEIKGILINEGIRFILLHETPNLKNRVVTRIKIMSEY